MKNHSLILLMFNIIIFTACCYQMTDTAIRDLFENIEVDASDWFFYNNVPNKVRSCSGQSILNEYRTGSTIKGFHVSYMNLPSHSTLYVSFSLWIINRWINPSNLLTISIGDHVKVLKPVSPMITNTCSNEIIMIFAFNHTGSFLSILFNPYTTNPDDTQSFGISQLTIHFSNSTLPAPLFYYSKNMANTEFSLMASSANIGSTSNCDQSCKICNGTTPLSCISCSKNYYYNGSQCLINPCLAGQYYDWNMICRANCNFPLAKGYKKGLSVCIYQCALNEFLFWDQTCLQNCSHPLRIHVLDDRNYCLFPCNNTAFYLYANYSCLFSCNPPFLKKIVGRNSLLCLPCDEGIYFNGSCASKCPAIGYQNISVQGIFMCEKIPCDGYFYSNETCMSSCPDFFFAMILSDILICEFPCNISKGESYFRNGTCSECKPPMILTYLLFQKKVLKAGQNFFNRISYYSLFNLGNHPKHIVCIYFSVNMHINFIPL